VDHRLRLLAALGGRQSLKGRKFCEFIVRLGAQVAEAGRKIKGLRPLDNPGDVFAGLSTVKDRSYYVCGLLLMVSAS